ncbi:hypothetical protein GCM10011607_28320 [Shewanella inventionis]|uniref:Uncharacterized protein n=1 Tax=Shewanella inventionis TaxID=1738770 RepID=A0ABQ1JDB7_9GAMM|nr:hypothetical protein [Shewanella inventionis]GGB65942.1 hypothetical protein GCM10011607_28320 [Shewanella inventionis]
MTATIEQDISQVTIENANDKELLESLKKQMIADVPETSKLFEPRYKKEFDWQDQHPHASDEQANDEMAYNRKLMEKKANESEIKTLVVAEMLNALLNKTGPQFKTTKLKQNYDDKHKVLDMALQAAQLKAMNDYAKHQLVEHMNTHGIDTPEAAIEAFKADGPGSFKELTQQFEASSAALMDIMQDASAICANNVSAPSEILSPIGDSIDGMTENMRELQETAVKNVMEMIDNVLAKFTK